MEKITIKLTRPQINYLNDLSIESELSTSELIRKAIDEFYKLLANQHKNMENKSKSIGF